jgi:hypothetical protein
MLGQGVDVQTKALDVDDEVPHKLSGVVAGDLAAAVDVTDGDAPPLQLLLGYEEILRLGAPPESDDGVVFQKQDHIADPAVPARGVTALLELQGFVVGNFSDVDDHHARLVCLFWIFLISSMEPDT